MLLAYCLGIFTGIFGCVLQGYISERIRLRNRSTPLQDDEEDDAILHFLKERHKDA